MKAIDLISRKEELGVKKKNILDEINELTASMERKSLEDYIRTGNAEQVDGHRLEMLQRKRVHIGHLEDSLNLEIGKLRKKERLKELQKLERKVEELQEKRKGSLYSKYLHFQSKIKALQEQDRKLKEEASAIKNQAAAYKREDLQFNFRLPELETFLAENYIKNPEELREKVEKAYARNQKSLTPGPKDRATELVRGFSFILNRDSGKIEEMKEINCGTDMARRNEQVMLEVVKC